MDEDNYNPIFLDDDDSADDFFSRYSLMTYILTCAILIVAYILLNWLTRKSARGNNVLLLGLSNSGKTLLFSRLLANKIVETFISVKENKGTIVVNDEKGLKVNIVDIPGPDSIRLRIFDQYKSSAKAIIFVVDSSTIQKELKDFAEFLHLVLTDSIILNNHLPILILCNKQDLASAKGSTVIKNVLEKELNQVRQTKSAALDSVDGKSFQANYLGNQKKEFSFSDLKRNPVEFIEFSCKKINEDGSDVALVKKWIASV